MMRIVIIIYKNMIYIMNMINIITSLFNNDIIIFSWIIIMSIDTYYYCNNEEKVTLTSYNLLYEDNNKLKKLLESDFDKNKYITTIQKNQEIIENLYDTLIKFRSEIINKEYTILDLEKEIKKKNLQYINKTNDTNTLLEEITNLKIELKNKNKHIKILIDCESDMSIELLKKDSMIQTLITKYNHS